MKKPIIEFEIWTEHFLGTETKAKEFLAVLREMDGGMWVPDKWNDCEPIKERFAPENEEHLIRSWIEVRGGDVFNGILFKKMRPYLTLDVEVRKGRYARLNYLRCEIEAKQFVGVEGVARLKKIVADFILWGGAAYATAWHSAQRHDKYAQGNPKQRLERLNWLNFFGRPYLALIGEQEIRNCPFYACEPLLDGLLVTADEFPDSPSLTESADRLVSLEQCLGPDLFADDFYVKNPCRVPEFDLSETVIDAGSDMKDEDDQVPEMTVIRDPETNRPLAVAVIRDKKSS